MTSMTGLVQEGPVVDPAPLVSNTGDPPPHDRLALQRLPLSAGQVRAIYGAMRTFRDDDRSRLAGDASFRCGRCGCSRPLAGSLTYGELRLCNGCATDYELMRTAGMEGDLLVASIEEPNPTQPIE
jgi:hypothetical protein